MKFDAAKISYLQKDLKSPSPSTSIKIIIFLQQIASWKPHFYMTDYVILITFVFLTTIVCTFSINFIKPVNLDSWTGLSLAFWKWVHFCLVWTSAIFIEHFLLIVKYLNLDSYCVVTNFYSLVREFGQNFRLTVIKAVRKMIPEIEYMEIR